MGDTDANGRRERERSSLDYPPIRPFGPGKGNIEAERVETANDQSQEPTGPNAELWKRESTLKKLSKQLRPGMSVVEVTICLGLPHFPFSFVTNGHSIESQRVSLEVAAPVGAPIYWRYTPNFDDSFIWDGSGYEELLIEFDASMKVAEWKWEKPVIRVRMKLPKELETK
jgi:hypothetical protein